MLSSITRRTLAGLAAMALVLSPTLTIAAESDDGAFLENLILLQGRIETARELIRVGKSDDALARHLGDNLNGRVARFDDDLVARKLTPLKPVLDGLVAASAKAETFEPAYAKAVAAIQVYVKAIPAAQLSSPKFMATALANVVDHAAADFKVGTVGVDGGKPVLKEYEETFGYNRAAVAFWKSNLKPALGDKASPALAAAFTSLESASPTAAPGGPGQATPAQFDAIAATLKAEAAKL